MAEGSGRSRSVLGDVTNTVGKRGISGREKGIDSSDGGGAKRTRFRNGIIESLQDNAASKSSIGFNLDRDGQGFAKRGNFVVGSSKVEHGSEHVAILELEGCERKNVAIGSSKVDCGSDNIANWELEGCTVKNVVGSSEVEDITISGLRGMEEKNVVIGSSKVYVGSDDIPVSSFGEKDKFRNFNNLDSTSVIDRAGEFLSPTIDKIDDGCDELCSSNVSDFLPGGSKALNENVPISEDLDRSDELRDSSWIVTDNMVPEGTQSDINNDQNADDLILSQSSSIDPDTKEGDCGYINRATDSIGGCSCSFCTKAACIWLDLHCQDIKGRVSAIRKSQKEAGILAERSCRNKDVEKHCGGRIAGVSKMEAHLMNQWRRLFQSTAGIWDEEGNRLEANLKTLAELRGKCKADLGLSSASMNSEPSEEH